MGPFCHSAPLWSTRVNYTATEDTHLPSLRSLEAVTQSSAFFNTGSSLISGLILELNRPTTVSRMLPDFNKPQVQHRREGKAPREADAQLLTPGDGLAAITQTAVAQSPSSPQSKAQRKTSWQPKPRSCTWKRKVEEAFHDHA